MSLPNFMERPWTLGRIICAILISPLLLGMIVAASPFVLIFGVITGIEFMFQTVFGEK